MGPSPPEPSEANQPPASDAVRKRPALRGRAAYTRRRAVTACQVCRARRTKCDNKSPSCSFCEKVGAKCIRAPTDFSSFDPASLNIIERLDRIEGLLAGQSNDDYDDNSRDLCEAGAQANELPSFRSLQIDAQEVLSWPIFGDQWVLKAKSIVVRGRETRSGKPPPSATLEFLLGNTTTSNEFVSRFIQHVHTKNPILELSSLQRMIHYVCLEGLDWNPESCLVLLVWALGAISTDFPNHCDPERLHLGASLFSAATKRLGLMLGESSIISAQCFFYAGVYSMSIFQPLPAWRYFLQALAHCQEFDFALEACWNSQPPSSPSQASATEQRLYWSCWKSEVELRMCLRTFDFQTQDRVYPEYFPNPPENPENDGRAWFFYLAEISLRRLNTRARNDLGRILASNEPKSRPELFQMVESYLQQVEAWRTSLPETISLVTKLEEDDMLKFILRCQLLDFYELVFWPFIGHCINDGERLEGVEEFARRGLRVCSDRIRAGEFGYLHRHHGTWMLMQSCARSAFVLLAAACSQKVQDILPPEWNESIGTATKLLQFWQGEDSGMYTQLQIIRELQAACESI